MSASIGGIEIRRRPGIITAVLTDLESVILSGAFAVSSRQAQPKDLPYV
ncbi:hypothetical protein [Granulicella sp. L60]|nr:hypothetical protein [Granulicella sp. L60]